VKTVLLFSWKADPRELDGLPIALTDHSATSAALVELLCRERYGIRPDYRVRPQNLAAMMAECEAALVIGDAALIEGTARRMLITPQGETARPYVFDLGDEWLKHTSLPFVFALWAARREAIEALLANRVQEALQASKCDGVASLDHLARAYAPRLGLPVGVCARYLHDLRFDLTEWDREGLERFLDHTLGADRPALEYLEAVAA
jgi:chorismate dehydratase